jgi:hypothetical protein
MNICRQFRENMFALLAGEVEEFSREACWEHCEKCSLCRAEWQAAQRVWHTLETINMVEVPEQLRQQTLAAVHLEVEKEARQASHVLRRVGALSLAKVSAAILTGIGLALFFIFLLTQKVEGQPLSSNQLLAIGTVWAGLLITGFSWTLGKFRFRRIQLSATAWLAIVATIVVMIGTYFCPDKTAFEWWSNSPVGTAAKNTLGPALSCCVFGMLYVLPAALLIAPAFRRKFKDPLLGHAATSALIYIALLLPAIYIQCANLAAGMMLSWIAGSLLGAMGGILGGLPSRAL